MCHNLKNKMKMVKIKKIINSVLLGVMMFLCLVVVAQAEEMPALESEKNTSVTTEQNPTIPTLENSIEEKNAEETAVDESNVQAPKKNTVQENIPQTQNNYLAVTKIILISTFLMALLALVASKTYTAIRKKNN